MITKAQALAIRYNQVFHFGDCTRFVGPRGGVKDSIVQVRASGGCKTWKTRPEEFRLPVKYGLYESGAVTQENAQDFHLVEDCPIENEQRKRDQALDSICGEGTAEKMKEILS